MESNELTQTPPAAPVPPAGKTVEQLQAEMDSLKRESDGRLRDLQNERSKRQELEAKLTPVVPTVEALEGPQDELGKLITPYIAAQVKPLQAKLKVAEDLAARTLEDKAMEHLVSKSGKSKQQIMEDRAFQDSLVGIAKRYGFTGNTYDVTVKAYEIMELEKVRAEMTESRRVTDAAANSSIPAGTPPPPVANAKEWDESTWSEMPLHEYEQYASKGSFHQSKDGKIVFTPSK